MKNNKKNERRRRFVRKLNKMNYEVIQKGNEDRRRKPLGFSSSGQSVLISHSLMLAITLILVMIIIFSIISLKAQYQNFIGISEAKQVCLTTKSSIEKIYSPENYTSQTNSILGKVLVNLPKRIADEKYSIIFVNKSAEIKISNIGLNYTCKVGFPVQYNGSTDGGLTEISWIRLSNSTDVINMRVL